MDRELNREAMVAALLAETGERRWSAVWGDAPACPFCNETGFDWPGLAWHISRNCLTSDELVCAQMASVQRFHEQNLALAKAREDHPHG